MEVTGGGVNAIEARFGSFIRIPTYPRIVVRHVRISVARNKGNSSVGTLSESRIDEIGVSKASNPICLCRRFSAILNSSTHFSNSGLLAQARVHIVIRSSAVRGLADQ